MQLLIDADVLCHQLAYSNTKSFSFDGNETVQATHPEKAKADTQDCIASLAEKLGADSVLLVLSDRERNFRKEFDPTYKLNRAEKPKPELWHVVRGFIESGSMEYPVAWYPRLEGDDVLGIMATHPAAQRTETVIVSIDKDMQGVPCRLYNPMKPDRGVRPISVWEAQRFHLSQVLTGDSTDGYPGLPGCGKVGAEKILGEIDNPRDAWAAIVEAYKAKKLTEKDALKQARFAYILQYGDYNYSTLKVKLWRPSRYAN